ISHYQSCNLVRKTLSSKEIGKDIFQLMEKCNLSLKEVEKQIPIKNGKKYLNAYYKDIEKKTLH
ncbi:hypothetical protein LCGC14_1400720, partial [marine sediment metagenome]